MHRITLLLILFLLIPDAYIYFMYIIRKTKNIWLRIIHWIPTLLLISGYFLLMQGIGENAMAHHAQAIGRLAIAIFLFAIPKTIFMICSLVGLPFHYLLRWPRSPFTAVGLVLGVASFFNILYGTLVGISKFEVKEIEFKREKIGEMPTEMFLHFFKSLSDAAKMNLNIKAEGQNEHHKIEGIFKALARALKMAIKRDIYHFELPSSKGVL